MTGIAALRAKIEALDELAKTIAGCDDGWGKCSVWDVLDEIESARSHVVRELRTAEAKAKHPVRKLHADIETVAGRG